MKDLEKRLDELVQVCHSMPWTDEGFYREWLAQTYYYVCHSTRLLALAMAQGAAQAADPSPRDRHAAQCVAALEASTTRLSELEEEHSGEDAAFSGFDSITVAAVKERAF